jgi:hypothetical protein
LASFWYLSNDPPWSTSHNAEARDNHIGWDYCSFKDSYEVFDNCELPDYAARADMDVIADQCSFDNRVWTHEDMVADLKRIV